MDQAGVAAVLNQIAAFLELQGENPFRVRAYHAAARAVAAYPGDLREALASGALAELTGIGPATLDIVEDIVDSGRSRVLDALRERIPPGLAEMMQISGLGVAKIRQIHETLGIDTIADLEAAARDGRLAKLPRFGEKTAANILNGIGFLRRSAGQRLYHHAHVEAETLRDLVAGRAGVSRAEIAGALRRRRETIGDIALVVEYDGDPATLADRLRTAPGVEGWIGEPGDRATLRLQQGGSAVLHFASRQNFGAGLLRATGSDAHLAALADRAARRGVAWIGNDMTRDGEPVPTPSETSAYEALGLPWIPPEIREGTGEVEAAIAGELPDLVTRDDLKGLIHCHTTYSDGTSTVDEWADAAREAGFEYLGITDHSPSTAYAGGLEAGDIARQHAEIDAANRRHEGIRVLKGVEVDILADGALDYDAETRRGFDFVIASVHNRLNLSAGEMTERVLTAISDPSVTILGHPTGRLLLSRDPYELDLDRVFEAAAAARVAVEINADPHRLDLDWRVLRRATAAGVTISIGADAHAISGVTNVDIGVGIARKGWLTARNVLNTRAVDAFLAFARRNHS